MKRLILLIVVFGITSCLNKERDEYVKNKFDVSFKGIVVSVKEIDRGDGVMCIQIKESNYKSFNEEFNGRFICKINNGYAKLITNLYPKCNVGDSINFNPNNNKRLYIYRNDSLIDNEVIFFDSYNLKYLHENSLSIDCGDINSNKSIYNRPLMLPND